MDVLHATSRKRETYEVKITYSTLWECALGIAAITNSDLINTLEKPTDYWNQIKQSLSQELLDHLDFVEKNNTWKALLQLLHKKSFKDLSEFTSYIRGLEATEFKFICLPFVGSKFQSLRQRAACSEEDAVNEMKKTTSENHFFPKYIEYISKADVPQLKDHLIEVMTGWHDAVIKPGLEETTRILKTDSDSKLQIKEKMAPEELVQWATGGVTYAPEPSVYQVLLIPQYIYRPWNIEADLEGTKVFYYPVANESIHPNDNYTPSNFLVLKHKALGDEARLKIVKLLSEHDRSLQDLTEKLDLGKSTIHHHLKILKVAKLVEVIASKYSLKRNALELLSKELDIFLKR